MQSRFLRHSLGRESVRWARRKVIGLAVAQCTFALVTIAVAAALSAGARTSAEPWTQFVTGLAVVVVLCNAVAVAGLLRGRAAGAHAGFLAVAPYPLAIGAAVVSGLAAGELLQAAVPVVVLALLTGHALDYVSDETREALRLWRASTASRAAITAN